MNRLNWLFRRGADHEISREIEAHIAERVDDLVDSGMDEAAAHTQARREFGNARLQVERSRDVWVWRWLTSVAQDLRYAVRSLARQPGFTLSAVGILAIAIGLLTTFATMMNAAGGRAWTVPDPDTLGIVVPYRAPGTGGWSYLSSLEYRYLRAHSESFAHLASWSTGRPDTVSYNDAAIRVMTDAVTANYFDALHIEMMRGRTFLPEEEDYRVPRNVVVISERLWRQHLSASDSFPGGTVRIRETPFTVVGIAANDFRGVGLPVDVWMPLPSTTLAPLGRETEPLEYFSDPGAERWSVFGRLRPGVTREAASAELSVLGRQFRESLSLAAQDYSVLDTRPISVDPQKLSRHASVYGLQFGALVLVLLLACANVGNLILARGLSRQREIAVRLSLGASRGRVVRQLMTESLLVSLAAGSAGIWIARALFHVRTYFEASDRYELRGFDLELQPSLDATVLLFVLATTAIACVISGVLPALRTTRVSLARRASERHAGRGGAGRLRTSLLATQIALSMVLLVGAGLLTRAVSEVEAFDPGFAIHETQAFDLRLPEGTTTERRAAFARALGAELAAPDLPLAFSDFTAIGSAMYVPLRLPGTSRDTAKLLIVRPVSSNYFSVLRIPILSGRSLSDDSKLDEVVVNETAARHLWPDGIALGRQLVSGNQDKNERVHRVVGVVKDVPTTNIRDIAPVVYWPPAAHGILLVRDSSQAVADRIASVARGIEPDARVTARPLANDLLRSIDGLVAGRRIAWAIALLALTLATIGAFGVFTYMVEERRREIGVRMALGAGAPQVIRTILTATRAPLITGLGAGLVLSMIGAQFLRSSLYGLSPFDPVTYLGISMLLIAAALLATWIPARRATRIDPAIALRLE